MEGVLSDAVFLASQLDPLSSEKTGFAINRISDVPRVHSAVSSLLAPPPGPDGHQPILLSALVVDQRTLSRKEKRKNLKKLKRKQIRQETAEKERLEELARVQDPAEELRIQEEEILEAERLEKERLAHEEQERIFQEREKKIQEEFERKQAELLEREQERKLQQEDEDENWRYVEDDGPAEIIWQGNEIIVKKKRVKVPAEQAEHQPVKSADQPTSNPLPPQSSAFAAHKLPPPSTPDVVEQNPIFGTEQDKTHCPFHIKTGVCRFGTRCSRVHVYPDQSFTLLMRNMYTGPGLSWDHDEGLEIIIFAVKSFSKEGLKLFWRPDDRKGINAHHSDEEVAEQFEEFYEDVHSEFLQFGELVNFKVCKNGSSHLRGNVYVHYQTEAGAQAAYNALNGRFYAGKQITCEFVGVTRWRVALCGEYMKGHHRPCSHGSACNFLHCFRNPRGEYDWADWDSPPPRYWSAKMAKLFGYERNHREDYVSYHDKHKRHRSSERARSYERRHRSKDRYSRVDDYEHSRHRARRRHSSRDKSYHSSSDDLENSPTHERLTRHRRFSPGSVGDGRRIPRSGDFDEKGRRYTRDSVHDLDTRQEEAASPPGDELEYTDRDRNYRRGSRRNSRRSREGGPIEAEVDRIQKTSKRESNRDSRRLLRGEERRYELIDRKPVKQEDRWRPDDDTYE